jgi:uncharacterized protein
MGSPVVHWEFWSENPAVVSDFYRRVFDWKITHHPELKYWVSETGGRGGINGGIMQPDRSGAWPAKLSFYIAVDDLDAYGKKITDAGGRVVVDKQQIPGMGSFSLFEDPEGRVMGLWKQG